MGRLRTGWHMIRRSRSSTASPSRSALGRAYTCSRFRGQPPSAATRAARPPSTASAITSHQLARSADGRQHCPGQHPRPRSGAGAGGGAVAGHRRPQLLGPQADRATGAGRDRPRAPFKKRASDPDPTGAGCSPGALAHRTVAAQLVERFHLKRLWARDVWHLTSRTLRKVPATCRLLCDVHRRKSYHVTTGDEPHGLACWALLAQGRVRWTLARFTSSS